MPLEPLGGTFTRPAKRQDSGQHDLLRLRLDQIADPAHAVVKTRQAIDWYLLEGKLERVCRHGPGQPRLRTRLMAGVAILKHMHNLSEEGLCARWLRTPYDKLFCGQESFRHMPPFDQLWITPWRRRMGDDWLEREPASPTHFRDSQWT
jgi:IS5 family transposase